MSSNGTASAHVIFEDQTEINGVCQLGRKVVPHDSKNDLPLAVSLLPLSALLQLRLLK